MFSTLPPLGRIASLFGRVAVKASAAVGAPVQRGSRRNAHEAMATDRMRARAQPAAPRGLPAQAAEAGEAQASGEVQASGEAPAPTRTDLGA